MDFKAIKAWAIAHLGKQLEPQELSKSLAVDEILTKASYPVGTVRTWKGKKYIKTAPGKWQRKYESAGRGANQAIKNLMKKIEDAGTPEELYQLIMQNQSRFRDENGRMLPEVQQLHDLVQKRQEKVDIKNALEKTRAKGQPNNRTVRQRIVVPQPKKKSSDGKNKMDSIQNESPKKLKTATKEEVKQFLKDAMNTNENRRISLGDVTDSAKERIKDKTGKQVNRILLDSGEIRHAMKKAEHHINLADFEKVYEIVNTTNKITLEEEKHQNNDVIRFVEEVENGINLIMEFRAKKGDLSLVTAYRIKRADAPMESPGQTSETLHTSDSSIPHPKKKSSGIEIIKEKYNASQSIDGDEDEIYVGGETISGKWKLVEAGAPSASHDEKTFQKTKGFPTDSAGGTINDRDYEHDKAAQEAVIDMAGDYDGRALSFDSPVVVTTDGVVISGNNRTMSSKIAARNGTDTKYIDALKKRAKKFGFTAEDVDGFKNPRVVFETDSKEEYSTEQFAKFNRSGKKAMDPIESAVKVSKIIKTQTIEDVAGQISEFDTLGELYADKKAVHKVFNSFIDGGLIQKTDLPAYFTDSGITGAGKEFLETVMIGSVIDEGNIRQLNSEGTKSIRQKLVRAITPLIENKGMKGYSINRELNDAVRISVQVAKNKEKFPNVEEFSKQQDMFEKLDPVAVELAKRMEGTQKEFASFMSSMNGGLRPSANGEVDIFLGEVESKEQIVSRMLGIKKSVQMIMAKSLSLLDRVRIALGGA